MNISERSETELKNCADFDTYSATKDQSSFTLDIIQTHQLAPSGDPLVDADSSAQSYHTVNQLSGESINKYRNRIEDKIRILEILGLDIPSQQQQAMRFLFSLDPVKRADMTTDLKNDELKNPDTTYPVDLVSMCDLRQINVVNLFLLEVKSQHWMWFLILQVN